MQRRFDWLPMGHMSLRSPEYPPSIVNFTTYFHDMSATWIFSYVPESSSTNLSPSSQRVTHSSVVKRLAGKLHVHEFDSR